MFPAPPSPVSAKSTAGRFAERFGVAPRLFRAPGRINIIGEHTDYSGGLVLPAAIDRHCFVAAAPNGTRRLRIVSGTLGLEAEIDLDALAPRGDWTDYLGGIARVLTEKGVTVDGADLWIDSEVPVGKGVSSSAALEVATVHALLALAGRRVEGREIAIWAQEAENRFVGMPCGIMDQFASANGVAGCALKLDCATLETEILPIPDHVSFIVVDSAVRHAHVGGDYGRRREECDAAARTLGLARLGEADEADLPSLLPRLSPVLARRCRHVARENARVRRAAQALRRGDVAALGALIDQSHASLRDDMEVSVAAVDDLVEIARGAAGVLGARMMGGGFGGCVLALAPAPDAEAIGRRIQARYGARIGRAPDAFVCRAVGGAGEVAA